MGYCIKKRLKNYKGKQYTYFELYQTYRDPQNWKRVVSKFKAHLGRNKSEMKQNLERFKQEGQGKFIISRLVKVAKKEMKKQELPVDAPKE